MFSSPQRSYTHRILKALAYRKTLPQNESQMLAKYNRGFTGEVKLAAMLKEYLRTSYIPIYSLQLDSGGNEFQMDCLLIFSSHICMLDAKNYFGDIYIENNNWYFSPSDKALQNPLEQLSRSERLLKDFLQNRNLHLPITGKLIFMDDRLQLYNAQRSMPIVFPGQHDRFMNYLNTHRQPLSQDHDALAEKLKVAHIKQSRHEYIPIYEYDKLRKGVFCIKCGSKMEKKDYLGLNCNSCKKKVQTEIALEWTLEEFQLLFPNKPLTTDTAYEWTDKIVSKSTIRRFLTKNYERRNKSKGTFYC